MARFTTPPSPSSSAMTACPGRTQGERAAPAALAPAAGWRAGLAAAVELTKPRITKLVTITAGVGFLLSALLRDWGGGAAGVGGGAAGVWGLIVAALGCLAGTTLSAAGANALNEWIERERDARMKRTMGRPVPSGRLSPVAASLIGLSCSVVGVAALWLTAGAVPALVSLSTILLYVLLYTPLKTVTPLSTIIGAVPGALPPVIGWTAAAAVAGTGGAGAQAGAGPGWGGLLEVGGWSLFMLMFVWQIPHFLAIAWMYREDYAKGGYRMLPLTDPDGRVTFATILIWATLLVPATVLPAAVVGGGVDGSGGFLWVYAMVAAASGAAFLASAWRLAAMRTLEDGPVRGEARVGGGGGDRAAAKRVFVWSIIHLPLLLVVLVGEALITAW